MTLTQFCLTGAGTVIGTYLAMPAVVRVVTFRRVAMASVTAGVLSGVVAIVWLLIAAANGPVRSVPWYGVLNGQATHCTLDVYASGDTSLNDCWR